MREYTSFPDNCWVVADECIDGVWYKLVGFVLCYDEEKSKYRVSIPELGHKEEDDFSSFSRYRLKRLDTEKDVKQDLIDFALDHYKDERLKPYGEEWLREMTEGEPA